METQNPGQEIFPAQEIKPLNEMQQLAKLRLEALQKLQKIVSHGEKFNIDKKDLNKALKAILDINLLYEGMLQLFASDVYKIADAVSQTSSNIFSNTAVVKAVLTVLEEKGLLKEEDVKRIAEEKIIPQMFAEMQKRNTIEETEISNKEVVDNVGFERNTNE